MKIKKAIAIFGCIAVISTYSGCGQAKGTDALISYCFSSGKTEYLGMSQSDLNKKCGNLFMEEKASETGNSSYTYDLGECKSLFGGKITLPDNYSVSVECEFEDDKLRTVEYIIGERDKSYAADAKKLETDLTDALKEKLDDGFTYRWSSANGHTFEKENGKINDKIMVTAGARIDSKSGEIVSVYPVHIKFLRWYSED